MRKIITKRKPNKLLSPNQLAHQIVQAVIARDMERQRNRIVKNTAKPEEASQPKEEPE